MVEKLGIVLRAGVAVPYVPPCSRWRMCEEEGRAGAEKMMVLGVAQQFFPPRSLRCAKRGWDGRARVCARIPESCDHST